MSASLCAPRLFVDMDGTLAEWNTGASMADLRRNGYYASLQPNYNLIRALYVIRNFVELHILSAYLTDVPYPYQDKQAWLSRYMPFIPDSHIHMVPYGTCKASLPILRNHDVLLDDYTVNLIEWNSYRKDGRNLGLQGLKALNGINGQPDRWTRFGIATHAPYPGISVNILNPDPDDLAVELYDDVRILTEPALKRCAIV